MAICASHAVARQIGLARVARFRITPAPHPDREECLRQVDGATGRTGHVYIDLARLANAAREQRVEASAVPVRLANAEHTSCESRKGAPGAHRADVCTIDPRTKMEQHMSRQIGAIRINPGDTAI